MHPNPASVTPTLPLAQIAASEYRRRAVVGQQAVWDRKVSPGDATRALRPWLAIACLAGAELAELDEGLADLRTAFVHADGVCRDINQAEARAMLAAEICTPPGQPRVDWRTPLLTAARKAWASLPQDPKTAPPAPGSDEAKRHEAARNLIALAAHFDLGPISTSQATEERAAA